MMERIWQAIIANRANPLFWPFHLLLAFAALIYRLGLTVNQAVHSEPRKISTAVISVGNLTVGGSGKTPVVMEIARHLISRGKKVGVVVSGYRRKRPKPVYGPGAEIARMNIEYTGDEMMLMAGRLPEAYFGVDSSKTKAAMHIDREFTPDVILIDDGFQHRRLHRDMDIVLLNAGDDPAGEFLFPLGRLREPLKSLARADIVILTRANYYPSHLGSLERLTREFPDKPVYEADFINDFVLTADRKMPLNEWSGKNIYFFAGIGSFAPLLDHLRDRNINIAGHRRFPDHCRYTPKEVSSLRKDLQRIQPDNILTTSKDYVKVKDFDFGGRLYYLDLEISFRADRDEFYKRIAQVSV